MDVSQDFSIPLRTEELFTVKEAGSINNIFCKIDIPQNPGLAENNWNSGHQDSYCSESVKLKGPTGKKLRLIVQYNDYGYVPIMTCNKQNQMIGVSYDFSKVAFTLVVFDSECRIISATEIHHKIPVSFGGGYFYLNEKEDAVVVSGSKLACYPTRSVAKQDSVYSLEPIWTSSDLVLLITKALINHNHVYAAMPVWSARKSLYWVMLPGSYDFDSGSLISNAYIAVAEITPDSSEPDGCRTQILDSLAFTNQWINNTMAVSEEGVFLVTNGCDDSGACNSGYLHSIGFDTISNKISTHWATPYQNSGLLKVGQKNIGSGTTPTLFKDEDGTDVVAFTDNAYPKMHVVTCNRKNGKIVSQVPVFPDMQGCAEASVIGVKGRVVVENNFGHTTGLLHSQYVPNVPGLKMIEVGCSGKRSSLWETDGYPSGFFAMSMLARESGVIFAFTGEWNVPDSATKGGLYSIMAIDSWDGRIIWRIPIGQGKRYCHDYGGIYFNRTNCGSSIFVGTENYLVSIQDYE
jgi:hypothetical protein